MDKTEKNEMISQIKDLITGSTAIYLVDYSKVNVEDINNIRREFLKEGVKYKIFKNTLFKKALLEVHGYEKLNDLLVGMTGFAFVKENATAPAKIIKKYFTVSGKLPLKGCYIESQYYDGSQLEVLSTLPTKAEVIAGVLGSLNSPASGLVGVLNSVIRDLLSVVEEIEKQKAA